MVKRKTIKKLFLFFSAVIFSLGLAEFALRIFIRSLGSDLLQPNINPRESPFIFNERVGYELKPFALVKTNDDNGVPCLERLNSEGFRGPEYAIPKPGGIFRILAIGDSTVQGFNVSYKQTWEQLLENMLNHHANFFNSHMRYEVINAGHGGYVSRQVLVRLLNRGLKYQPDFVFVLVGLNDIYYSSLSCWTPLIDLTVIERAYFSSSTENHKNWLWATIRLPLYRYSYLARLVREARNGIWNTWRIHNQIREHQRDSGLVFNEKALGLYLQHLEGIYKATKENRAGMGLIILPTIIAPELLHDSDIHSRLLDFYFSFPLSTRELWSWYRRYVDAQRKFAANHPDIILIDAATAFRNKGKKERLLLFTDFCHLTAMGQRLVVEIIFNSLIQKNRESNKGFH